MTRIISHDAKESVGVFVGDPFEFRGREIENVGRLGKDVGNRGSVRRRSPVGFDEETVEGDLLDELAVVHGMIVKDGWPNRDKTIELDNLWNKPARTGKPMKKE